MKKNMLILIAIIFSLKGFSQGPSWLWAKQVGGPLGDTPYSMTFDATGNIYMTGVFRDTVDFDPGIGVLNLVGGGTNQPHVFVSKSDFQGNLIWAKGIGNIIGAAIYSYDVIPDASGNVYITGYNTGTVDFDPGPGVFNQATGIFICKLDNSGNFLWAKRIGTAISLSFSVKLDASGNICIAGYFYNTVDFDPGAGIFNLTSNGDDDIFFAKYDNSGNFIWAKSIGGAEYDYCFDMTLDALGNIFMTGGFNDTVDFDPGAGTFNLIGNATEDIFIAKYDNSGNFIWAAGAGGNDSGYYDRGTSLTVDATGNVYATGTFTGTADFDPGLGVYNLTAVGNQNIFISKLDGAGNFLGAWAIGGIISGQGNSIAVDVTGNMYSTGSFLGAFDFDPGPGIFTLSSGAYSSIYISKLDNSGNFGWAKTLSGDYHNTGQAVAISPSGYVHLTGGFGSSYLGLIGLPTFLNAGGSGNTADFFLAKLDTLITGVSESEASEYNLSLSPNPATNELRIENAELRIERIEIYNVLGEKILSQISNFKSQISVDISQLPSGIYFIKVSGEKEERVAKFVKQ